MGANLGEGSRVNLVLGSNFDADGRLAVGVIGCSDTSLNSAVNAVIIRSGQEAHTVGGSDGHAVHWSLISERSGILGQSSLLDVETCLTANQETFMGNNTIYGGVNVAGCRDKLAKGAYVKGALLEVQVALLRLETRLGCYLTDVFGFDASGEDIIELEFGGQDIRVSPGAGCGDA